MAKRIPEEALQVIEAAARRHPEGVTAKQISRNLKEAIPLRTLQYRLKYLVDNKRLVKEGEGRWAKYLLPQSIEALAEVSMPLSKIGAEIQNYVRKPVTARKPAGFNREFLESYRPNVSFYLSPREHEHLREVGKPTAGDQPAGTYAKQILNRLLIDLSWNSSRLEGNTYSLLDTKRLIDFGQEAEGKERLEAQMILNHKEAIEFLVSAAEDIGFNRYTVLNLHALLANNLLADSTAVGRLRHIPVGIEKSAFHPLEVPQLIEECFDQILATAAAIKNLFEQSFFIMVQLSYLQPFDDVNKRVSRLAANIPLIKGNLPPLSFTEVPRSIYTDAMLGVYELNKIDLLKDLFIWAYERSAARYVAVRQSLGEPDPFRLRYRVELREIIGEVVRGCMSRKRADAHITAWVQQKIEPTERDQFRDVVESELLGLHEGNFARYQIRPSEFNAWQQTWIATSAGTTQPIDQ
ncbi:MAG: Fic family protein [Deltaproteobacteria bacterium]|nr:Fic family protein [Deltaproteobacteria bacterium]